MEFAPRLGATSVAKAATLFPSLPPHRPGKRGFIAAFHQAASERRVFPDNGSAGAIASKLIQPVRRAKVKGNLFENRQK